MFSTSNCNVIAHRICNAIVDISAFHNLATLLKIFIYACINATIYGISKYPNKGSVYCI